MTGAGWSIAYAPSKGRWTLKYKDGSAWRQTLAPATIGPRAEKEARAWATAWLATRTVDGILPRPRTGGPLLQDLAPRWLEYRRGALLDGKPRWKPATIAENKSQLASEILPAFGAEPAERLEPQALRRWIRGLAGRHAATRVRNIYYTLVAFLDDAMAEGWVQLPSNSAKHPAVAGEVPPAKLKSGPIPIVMELHDVRALVTSDAVPFPRRIRWLVLATTGADEGEVAGRVWADVDLGERPTLRIASILATRGPDGWATLGATKNEYRSRTIPLHAAAAEALRWWYAVGWAVYVGRPPRPNDPIFPSAKGRFSRSSANARLLRADLAAAGCPTHRNGVAFTTKALRRSFSTWLEDADVHEEQRGRLMGHAPKTVTARHYTAAQVDRDREAVNRIALPFLVPAVVQNLVQPAPNQQDSSSHLGDLNPRPTVYETGTTWCHGTPGRDTRPVKWRVLARKSSGANDSDGHDAPGRHGAGTEDSGGARTRAGKGADAGGDGGVTPPAQAPAPPSTSAVVHASTRGAAEGDRANEARRGLRRLRTSLAALTAGWAGYDAWLCAMLEEAPR